MNIEALAYGAVLIETVVEVFKKLGNGGWKRVGLPYWLSLLFGVTVSVVYGLDLFETVGLETAVPYVGSVLSGLILSRGANLVSEIIARVTP